ncbi:hypothetical protein L249_6596 [Ophiocordyceps polyrhachis-furcata BCC 54312]|uniref:Uncharacterized protein n=1 Tax=Ophiocordyceps polyrhachis-furcata BCC 54312 TaxID=1330021 RepID=A0A367LKZ4_9HYPO|nr:hypothetical protein L249_6596 [Ophiocordyceps polyrhachis-furcata BCC 54312]
MYPSFSKLHFVSSSVIVAKDVVFIGGALAEKYHVSLTIDCGDDSFAGFRCPCRTRTLERMSDPRDEEGKITKVRCGLFRSVERLPGVRSCYAKAEEVMTCTNGIRVRHEVFPQEARCGDEKVKTASGDVPQDEVGCYRGRLYVNSRGCCSVDYALASYNRKGRVTSVRCGRRAGLLLPDNVQPENIRGVPLCKGNIPEHWCPYGIIASLDSLKKGERCRGYGCCTGWEQTRDKQGVCRRKGESFLTKESAREYWEARLLDGSVNNFHEVHEAVLP